MPTDRGPDLGSPLRLFDSAKRYLATWVDLFRTRLDLFTTELQEEREHLQQSLLLAATALFCLAFGILLVTLFVVVAFWDTNYRLVVLGAFALLYLVTGAVVAAITRRKQKARPKLLSATLGELAKDYRNLSS